MNMPTGCLALMGPISSAERAVFAYQALGSLSIDHKTSWDVCFASADAAEQYAKQT